MLGNHNIRVQNAHTIGSPPPTLPCLYQGCPRHFRNRAGRTNHIRAKHPGLLENAQLGHNPSPPPSRSSSPLHDLSSDDPTNIIPPADEEEVQGIDHLADAQVDPPSSPMEQNHHHDAPEMDQDAPEPPRAGRIAHKKINGT